MIINSTSKNGLLKVNNKLILKWLLRLYQMNFTPINNLMIIMIGKKIKLIIVMSNKKRLNKITFNKKEWVVIKEEEILN